MKPFVQNIPLQPNMSLLANTFSSPYFETGWHLHEAYELILFKEGNGLVNIGNHESIYKPGDIFFLGSSLPHRFQPNDNNTSALIIQFSENWWGKDFLNCPECQPLKQVLKIAVNGLQISGKIRNQLLPLMQTLETSKNVTRIILLLQCLQIVSLAKEFIPLNTAVFPLNQTDYDCMDKILKYTNTAFHEPVSLSKVAAIACKSIPSFCHYFKSHTQKTYFNYLNEVRIAYACSQLLQTDKPVVDIGYESGYNTVAHFHRQFLRLRKTTPLQYRKCSANQHRPNETI